MTTGPNGTPEISAATLATPLNNLSEIRAPSDIPEPIVGASFVTAEANFLETDNKDSLLLQSLKNDIKARKTYAMALFVLISVWLVCILGIILCAGFKGFNFTVWGMNLKAEFVLSDTVITALIGATTANVIGLFVVVVNYFFSKPKDV